jgi:AraC-like DNA-binding protein
MISRRAARAFHAYGQIRDRIGPRGGLAPWQGGPACHMMTPDLADRVTIAELAEGCGLSVSYFVGAFRKTMGVPPRAQMADESARAPG